MTQDELDLVDGFSQNLRSPLTDVLVGKPVKAVLAQPVTLRQVPRQGVGARGRRQGGMESGIKDRVLHDPGQGFEAGFDHAVGIGVVNGRQRQAGAQPGEAFLINAGGGVKHITAVNKAVPDRIHPDLLMVNEFQHLACGCALCGQPAISGMCHTSDVPFDHRFCLGVRGHVARLTGNDHNRLSSAFMLVHLETQRGTTAVDHQDVHSQPQ